MNTSYLVPRSKDAFVGPYWKDRWRDYLHIVSGIAAFLQPASVLEIGAYDSSLMVGSDTMDIRNNPSIRHDARSVPWPIADKAYDLAIATQVWEHLGPSQLQAFLELRRTCSRAILSFPYRWMKCAKDNIHYNITKEKIDEWTDHTAPVLEIQAGIRLIRLYVFEEPGV